MPRIFSIGNTCLDIILRYASRLPRWSTEILFEECEWRLGGQATNFALAAKYLDLTPILVSSLGTDDAGRRLLAELKSTVPVNRRLFALEDAVTGFTIALVRHDGERSFFTHLGHQNLFSIKPVIHDVLSIAQADDVVHVSGFYMLPKFQKELPSLFNRLRSNDVRISFDPGWNPNGFDRAGRAAFYKILSYVDFYEPNREELKQLSGKSDIQSAIRRVKSDFSGILAVKLGRKGSMVVETSGKTRILLSYPTHVADTTGAGDVFDAGLIAGVVRNLDLGLSARMGNAAASIAISRRGKTSLRFPKLNEVQALLGEQ